MVSCTLFSFGRGNAGAGSRVVLGSREARVVAERTGMGGPLVEPLEGRVMLAAVAWDGGGDGTSFADPFNWSNNLLPGAADDVTINVAGSPLIAFNGGLFFINSLNCAETFALSGGTLSIAAASTVSGAFTQTGGSLSGFGGVTLSGGATLTGGSMEGQGRTTVPTGVTATVNGDVTLLRALDVAGTLNWSAGAITLINGSVNVLSGGSLNAGGQTIQSGGGANSVTNAGTLNKFGAGQTSINAGVSFSNTGTVNVPQGGTLSLFGGGVSSGTMNVAGSLGLDGSHVFFASSVTTGAGDVTTFAGSTIFNGTISARLLLVNGPGTTTLNGAVANGTSVTVAGGSLATTSGLSLADLTVTSGAITGNGNITVSNVLTWSGGSMTGTGTTTVAAGATALFDGGAKQLSRRLAIAGTANWTSGPFQLLDGVLATTATGVLNLSAAGESVSSLGGTNLVDNAGTMSTNHFDFTNIQTGVVFSNTGTLNVERGHFQLSGATVVQIDNGVLTGGTWNLGGGYAIFGTSAITANVANVTFSGGGSFNGTFNPTTNSGTIAFRNGAGFNFGSGIVNTGTIVVASPSVSANSTFANNGTVRVEPNGILYLYGQSTHQGVFVVDGQLDFAAGQTLTVAGSVTGAGTLRLYAPAEYVVDCVVDMTGAVQLFGQARVFFNNTTGWSAGYLNNPGTTLAGSGAVTIRGAFNWNGGEMSGTGVTTFAPTSVLSIEGNAALLRREIVVQGVTNVNATLLMENARLTVRPGATTNVNTSNIAPSGANTASSIDNAGTLRFNTSCTLSDGVAINNTGTVQTANILLNLLGGGSNSGVFDIGTSSTITFGASTMIAPSSILAGTGTFNFTAGSFVLNGTISPSVSISIQGATVEFPANRSLQSLTINSGVLTGSGSVTVTGSFTMFGGRIEGSGRLTVGPAAGYAIGQVGGTVAIARPLDILGSGTISSTTVSIEQVAITVFATATTAVGVVTFVTLPGQTGAFDIAGTVDCSGVTFSQGVRLSNSGVLRFNGGAVTIDDTAQLAGVLEVQGSSPVTFNESPTFFPTSTFTLQSGSVRFAGTQTIQGALTINSGSMQFDGGATFQGAVTSSGQLTIAQGATFQSTLVIHSGLLAINQAAAFQGAATINGGLMQLSQGGTFGGLLTLGGPSLGQIHLGADVTLAGGLAWTGGGFFELGSTNNGRINLPVGTTATVSTSNNHFLYRPIDVFGAFSMSGGGSLNVLTNLITDPMVRVQPGGGFSVTNTTMQMSANAGNVPRIENFGTVTISNTTITNTSGRIDTRSGATTTFSNVLVQIPLEATLDAGGTWNVIGSNMAPMNISNAGVLTFVSGNSSVRAITNSGSTAVNGGTLNVSMTTNSGTLTGASSATINFEGTSLVTTGASTLSINGTANLTYNQQTPILGTVNIAGSLNNQTGGIFTFAGTTTLTGTLTGGNITNTGTLNWNSGTISTNTGTGRLTNALGATLNIQGASAKSLSRQVDNYGALNWTGGNITANGGIINNLATGVLAISAAATFSKGAGIAAIQNLGVINKTGSGTTTLGTGAAMYNAATTNILTGTLALNGGGLHSGVFITSPGASLSFAGVHLVSGACGFEGPGTVTVTGGSLTVTDMLSPNGSLVVLGGTVSVGTTSMLANLTLSGGSLGGAGDVFVSGALVWTGGTLAGMGTTIVLSSATATLGAGTGRTLDRSLALLGTTTMTGGLTITGAGVLTIVGNTTIAPDVSGNALTNAGLIVIDNQQTLTVPASFTLNNTGTIEARNGVFTALGTVVQLSGGTLSGGTYVVGEGSAINLPTADITTIGTGAGVRLAETGSFVSLAGLTTVAGTLALGGGRALSVTPNGGTLNVSGTLDVAAAAVLDVTGAIVLAPTARTRLGLDTADLATGLGQVIATTTATLGGRLEVVSTSAVDPAAITFFAAVSAPVVTGTFAVTTLPVAGPDFKYVTVFGDAGLSVLYTLKSDFNNDGIVDPDDLADFIGAFFSGQATSDFNGDGTVDPDDLADYIGAYFG